MCGICGFAGSTEVKDNQINRLKQMTDAIAHRGPDGGSWWLENGIGLGHRRLAIIDLHTGDQPMWDASREQVIVFNGEIYNYPELKQELEAKGHTFLTSSDTEIIMAAVKEWGIENGLLRLRGMFAFGLYNTRTKRLLLARDRVGIKPMFWTRKGDAIYFASEVKSLLETGQVDMKMDTASIHDYLALGFSIAPRTAWKDVHALPPGSWLEFSPDGQREGTFWQWTPRPDESVSEQEWLNRFEEVLSDSLRCHLLSDVPLGAFLSGGIDSSLAVALLASHHVKDLNTFNIGFDDQAFNEAPFARMVAEQYKTNHHEIEVSSRNADTEVFLHALEQFDEPFADTASLPNYLLSQATAKHVKVVLSGDGGDEILGGYPFYKRLKQVEAAAKFRWADPVLRPALSALTGLRVPQAKKLLKFWESARGGASERLTMLNTLYLEAERFNNYAPAFREAVSANGATYTRVEPFIPADMKNPMDRMFALEFRMRLQNGYLRKVDVTSSAHGLETRVPFLDNRMLEFSETLPASMKIKDGQLKYLGYRLAEKYLPPQVVNRPKHGFNFPFDDWSRTPKTQAFLRDLLFNPQARWTQILQPNFIEEAWAVFSGERTSRTLKRSSAYRRVFSLTSLEIWLKKWNVGL
jgi:asparagine synthase (glutamine-hydrolysing)